MPCFNVVIINQPITWDFRQRFTLGSLSNSYYFFVLSIRHYLSDITHFLLFFLYFVESYNLPAKPSLELAVGQIKSCLKQMGKSGLGVCAFANVEDFVSS